MKREYRDLTSYELDELRDEEADLESTWHSNTDYNGRIDEIESDVKVVIDALDDDDLKEAKRLLNELADKLY